MPATQAGAVHAPPVGDAEPLGVGVGEPVGLGEAVGVGVPAQAPWSAQTAALPGVSPWVHHFALQVCPAYETVAPPEYAVAADHAGAVQVPPPGGVEPLGLGDCVTTSPPRAQSPASAYVCPPKASVKLAGPEIGSW